VRNGLAARYGRVIRSVAVVALDAAIELSRRFVRPKKYLTWATPAFRRGLFVTIGPMKVQQRIPVF